MEVVALRARFGSEPEAAFRDDDARQLRFATNQAGLDIIRVRSFDVATFVAFGAAHLGVACNDVLMEFDYPEPYAPVDPKIRHCRLAVETPPRFAESDYPSRWSPIRLATQSPDITTRHFASRRVPSACTQMTVPMRMAKAS